MVIKEKQSLIHWNYFIALEEDIERLSRFVEFTTSNFNTYSIEIAHIFLAASSEVDVVAKQLCTKIDSQSKVGNIDDYRKIIDQALPEIKSSVVTLPRYGLDLNPWSNWQGGTAPNWWRQHNQVKHLRQDHFELANLKNVLNSMAGLFLLILHLYHGVPGCDRIEPPPSIFTPPEDLANICPTIGGRMALFYELDQV